MKKFYLGMLLVCSSALLNAQSWTEDFDSSTSFPEDWTIINQGDSKGWEISTFGPQSGPNSAIIKFSTTAHDDYLITPKYHVSDDSKFFSFSAKNKSASSSSAEEFDVLVSTTGKEIGDFTHVVASNIIPPVTYEGYNYNLSAFLDQDIYVAFYSKTRNKFYLYIDDVIVSENGVDYLGDDAPIPITVDCDDPILNETYCYGNNENWRKLYTNDSNKPLQISYSAGNIEGGYSGTFDDLVIYDGTDNTGTVIFRSDNLPGNSVRSLEGVIVVATSGNLYITFTSDSSRSCGNNGINNSWEYNISCTQDTDNDGVYDDIDNCISTYNPDQLDSNDNGIGDACETCENPTSIVLERTSNTTATFAAGDDSHHYQGTANRAGRPIRPYPMYGMTDMESGHVQTRLIPEFEYDLWFRTICGEENYSEWVGPVFLPKYEMAAIETGKVSISPNPTIGKVNILDIKAYTIVVYDINGRNIKTVKAINNSVDITELPSGPYFLKIVDTEGKSHYTRVIKK